MTTFERIKFLADKQKISLKSLASILGFSENYFYNMKNTKSSPSSEILTKVADYFNVSVDYLLGREEASKSEIQKPKVQILARQMDTKLTDDEIDMLGTLIEKFAKDKFGDK